MKRIFLIILLAFICPHYGHAQEAAAGRLGAGRISDALDCRDTGSVNAIVCSTQVFVTSYTNKTFIVSVANTTTGATTININGIGIVNVTKNGTTAIANGDLVGGQSYVMRYDGTEFEVLGTTGAAVSCTNQAITAISAQNVGTCTTLTSSFLPATVVYNNQSNTYSNGTQDFTGATATKVTTQASTDSSTNAASTSFVQTVVTNAIAAANPAMAVKAATAAILPNSPTYNNGASGIGATITAGSNNVTLVVDGYTPLLNDRILVKNESDGGGLGAAKNGVYTVTQLAAVSLPWVLTRAVDFDQSSDMNNTGAIPVVNGTTNTDTMWLLTSTVTTVGTDAVTFTQFSLNPTTLVVNNGTNTGTANMTLDLSAATGANAFKVPVQAGCTAGVDGDECYDSTNKNQHVRTNGADSIVCAFSSIPTNGDLILATVASNNTKCADSGIAKANVPNVVYSTTSSTQTGAIGATTMITSTANGSAFYRIDFYATQIAVGVGCTSNTVIKGQVTFTDPLASGTTTWISSTFTIANNGSANTPLLANSITYGVVFQSKVSSAIQYGTSYTLGSGCTTNPSYQITPVLVQLTNN